MEVVLQVCAYGAEYGGNFIASLENLEKELLSKGYKTIYAFCEKARTKKWCQDISERTKIYYLPEAKARILPGTYRIFQKIYKENDISMIHTHFELYDIPATVMAPKSAKVFWHLHDPIKTDKGVRKFLWKFQYGFVGKKAILIAVSEVYRQKVIELGFPEEKSYLLLNGIDTSRLERKSKKQNGPLRFLSFGWDFYRKGDDLLLNTSQRLYEEGYQFEIWLNGNDVTWNKTKEYLNGKKLPFLKYVKQTCDISKLYNSCDVFVQASRKETFSYAVCEASYLEMPVISSDIAGLEWAHELPNVSFFENENEEELYERMKEFLLGKTYNEEIYKKSQEVIKNKYTVQAWSKNMMKYYNI